MEQGVALTKSKAYSTAGHPNRDLESTQESQSEIVSETATSHRAATEP